MNGSIYIFLYESFTKKNGVLVVVTFPCHKSDQRILTKSDLSAGSRRSVCDNLSFFDHITFCHDWTLVHTSTLVTSYKLRKFVFIAVSICLFDDDTVGLGAFYHTAFFRYDTVTRIDSGFHFHTCTNYRCFCNQKRHCLTLHVGSHQRTVCIVVFQEWDHGCRYREYHLRRYIHEINFISFKFGSFFTETTGNVLTYKVSVFIQCLIRLSHVITVFFVCCHVNDFIRYDWIIRVSLVYFAVWSFDKTILIDAGIGCQRVDQTDVRTFGRLDRTHSSIMRIVNVSDFESGTISGKTTGTKSRKTSLMCQFGQWVILVHKL